MYIYMYCRERDREGFWSRAYLKRARELYEVRESYWELKNYRKLDSCMVLKNFMEMES
jgi:hypothetical protein